MKFILIIEVADQDPKIPSMPRPTIAAKMHEYTSWVAAQGDAERLALTLDGRVIAIINHDALQGTAIKLSESWHDGWASASNVATCGGQGGPQSAEVVIR